MGEATGSLMAAAPVTIAAMSTARKFFIVVVMERYDEDKEGDEEEDLVVEIDACFGKEQKL